MPRGRNADIINGWVNLNKPYGLGSTSAVGKVRWLMNAKKAGHAGTLDPLASGVLPIALGEATKTVSFMQDAIKGYDFTVAWGENTTTWDVEGEVTETSDVRPRPDEIEAVLPHFIGDISQIPPKFSAIKVDGKRAYDLARGGEAVELSARTVTVDSLTLTDVTSDSASFSVVCHKGTYVRSLARDMASALGTCGHVTKLLRTRVGPFRLQDTQDLDSLITALEPARQAYGEALKASRNSPLAEAPQSCHRGGVSEYLHPVETALDDIPVLATTHENANDLKHGRAITLPDDFANADNVLVKRDGILVALCIPSGGMLRPKRVFNL